MKRYFYFKRKNVTETILYLFSIYFYFIFFIAYQAKKKKKSLIFMKYFLLKTQMEIHLSFFGGFFKNPTKYTKPLKINLTGKKNKQTTLKKKL